MKEFEIYLEGHPVLFGILAVFVPLLFPRVRAWVLALWRRIGCGRRRIEGMLNRLLEDVSEIKREVQFSNDTSTKQEVALLKKRSYLDFWRAAKPSIEMNGEAQVIHVSETLCRLMGVWTPSDLHQRNWLRCVDAARVDEFLNSFHESVKFKSDCDFVFHIQAKDGTNQGEWKLIMSDITPPGYSTSLYSGFFKPVDDRAKEVAAALHWSK